MTSKKEFLNEHNRLSSPDRRASMDTLARFEADKPMLVKDNDWSIEKVRRPFILWLTSQCNK